jgi:transposase
MPHQDRIVGIDISKLKVDACVHSRRLRRSFASTPPGERELIAWRRDSVGLAVMEASDGYERGWAAALRKAGIAVRIVDPNRVRFFAKSAGRLAKSDPIRACPRAGQRPDPGAAMIAWFAETFTVEVDQPHDPDRGLLDRLMTARRLLVGLAAQTRQLGEHRQPRVVDNAQRAMIKTIRTQLAKLEAAVQTRIAANAKLAAGGAIIHSVPGFGTQFVAAAIAWLPELGHLSNMAAAGLVGIAPYDDDSGGRREIRDLLYMATLAAAAGHNPLIKAYYQRLRANGKKANVALVACMRKLFVILNTMLARGQMWNPAVATPAPAEIA